MKLYRASIWIKLNDQMIDMDSRPTKDKGRARLLLSEMMNHPNAHTGFISSIDASNYPTVSWVLDLESMQQSIKCKSLE